jgi:hypothetical protein
LIELDEKDGDTGAVTFAVRNDTRLTEQQKQSLLETYASYVSASA